MTIPVVSGPQERNKERVLLHSPISRHSEAAGFRGDGAAFLGLSLFCGLAGGFLGLFAQRAGPFHSLSHGLLLDLFVLVPAFIGGMGRLVLPNELTPLPPAMICFDRIAFLALLLGAFAAVWGAHVPAAFIASLALWCVGSALLAVTTVIKCLECRDVRFRDLTPFAWSQLLASLGLIVVTPVLLAGLAHDVVAGRDALPTAQYWLGRAQVPVLALVVQLALGAIANLVAFQSLRSRIVLPVLMAIASLGVSVVWAHGVTVPGLSDGWLLGVGVAVPSLAIMVMICASLWRRSFVMTYALSWSFPAMLLLSAGWVLGLFPTRPEAFHSAMMFGAVFALFGCYYKWQAVFPEIAAPSSLCRIHLVSMGVALLAMMPALPVLQRIGEGGMTMSLICVAFLGMRLLMPMRQLARATR